MRQMEFRIADSFTDSLAHLTGEEQSAAKTTAFDLQMNPANPGMPFHELDRAKDKNFWSIRVSRDIRIIVHRTDQSPVLCYAGHHDPAYRWPQREHAAVRAPSPLHHRAQVGAIAIRAGLFPAREVRRAVAPVGKPVPRGLISLGRYRITSAGIIVTAVSAWMSSRHVIA
jgi:hypothetical protein